MLLRSFLNRLVTELIIELYSGTLDNDKEDLHVDATNRIVMGWGTNNHGGPGYDLLLEVEVDVDISCEINLEEITPRILCADSDGKYSCQWDSAGLINLYVASEDNSHIEDQVHVFTSKKNIFITKSSSKSIVSLHKLHEEYI